VTAAERIAMETIRVPGLTRLESLELKKRFPDAKITFDSSSGSDEAPGELLTVGLIAITLAGINALAAYFVMDTRKGRVEKTVEVVDKRGVRRKEKLVVNVFDLLSNSVFL
jgi:hypothetical protein